MSSTISSVRSSPIPDLAYDSYRSLSLRDQNLVKRQITSNNNFDRRTPLPQAQSQQPQPVPVRVLMHHSGKVAAARPSSFVSLNGATYSLERYSGETVAFWILLAILAVLAIGNAILTFVIFGVLRLGVGMESIEFLPSILKFYGGTDLDDIYIRNGVLQGFANNPVEITGDEGGEVHLWVNEGSIPSISVEKNVINFTQLKEFRVVDKKGHEIFSTNKPTLGLPRGVQRLDVRVAKANRITSAVNASLQLSSTTFTYLKGSEGTHLNGKQILLKADQDISLKTLSGNLILSGKDGIYLNVNDLPLVRESGVTRKSYTYTTQGKKEPQYQLCVCQPEGKLYKVEIPLDNHRRTGYQKIGCHSAVNPCIT